VRGVSTGADLGVIFQCRQCPDARAPAM